MSASEDYEAELFQDRAEACKRAADAEHKAQQLQSELDALKAAHAWIKTSERMPCPHVAVLGSDANGVVSKVLYFADDIWGYADDSNSAVDDPITHWMPLPEAPQ